MSQEISSVSKTVALANVELFFNQVTTGGGEPVALHAKETKEMFSLNDTNTFFGWIEIVGTAEKIRDENKKRRKINFTNVFYLLGPAQTPNVLWAEPNSN